MPIWCSDTYCPFCLDGRYLTALESLELCGGLVTDRGVSHVAPLLALRHLSLAHNPGINDASLLVLSSLTQLTFLNLNGARLTGNGIQHLQNLVVGGWPAALLPTRKLACVWPAA